MECAPERIDTGRLHLAPLTDEDLSDVYRIFGDPATWRHLPSGRHAFPGESLELISASRGSWRTAGFGPWAVRIGPEAAGDGVRVGAFVGVGGVTMTGLGVWNLTYRFAPAAWGHGFASEVARTAVQTARSLRPRLPVTARVLGNNPASAAVARNAGLHLVWDGPQRQAPATGDSAEPPHRMIFADKLLGGGVLNPLIALG